MHMGGTKEPRREWTSGSAGARPLPLRDSPAPQRLLARLRQRPLARAGSALKPFIAVLSSIAALVTAMAIIDPAALRAAMRPAADIANRVNPPRGNPAHGVAQREFATTLADLINRGQEVLLISGGDGAAGARSELVLWLRDAEHPGVIDAEELVIISHSPLFETVTAYLHEKSSGGGNAAPLNSSPTEGAMRSSRRRGRGGPREWPTGPPAMLDRAAVALPGFCDRWRARPDVRPRVIGTGISDLRIQPVEERESARADETSTSDEAAPLASPQLLTPDLARARLSLLRLTLRWGSDSSDGAGEATAFVKLREGSRPSAVGSPQAQTNGGQKPMADSQQPTASPE